MSVRFFFKEIFIRFPDPTLALSEEEIKKFSSMQRLKDALDIHEKNGGDLSNLVIEMNVEKRYFRILTPTQNPESESIEL